jgi:hypothetical protein
MGFMDGYGGGANAFMQNFNQVRQANQQNRLREGELAMAEQFRQAQMDQMAAQESERQRKASMEREALGRQMQLNQDLGAPVRDVSARTERPKTLAEQMAVLQQQGGPEGVKMAADFANKPQTMNPIVAKLIEAQQNGTINEQGKAILKMAGYDMFAPKPGPLVTDATGVRIADAPGVKVKPEGETWGEPEEMNIGGKRALVQKSSTGQIRPVIEDKSTTTTVNMQAPTQEETEVIAQLLADGKITMNDISKRGGVKQQAAILKRASELNPAIDPRADQAATSAFASSLTMQQRQLGMMGSFVKNMDYQVGRVKELGEELKTFDSRIMNVPLRAVRGKIAGSPLQAKYDMYITEIENEIGKLATGSAASISELSVGAQEKWAKIHDKNLSVKDMVSLLEETSKAGKMRMQSVESQLAETKTQMRGRGGAAAPSGIPQGAIDYLKQNPKNAIFFDQKYGSGASKRVLGR